MADADGKPEANPNLTLPPVEEEAPTAAPSPAASPTPSAPRIGPRAAVAAALPAPPPPRTKKRGQSPDMKKLQEVLRRFEVSICEADDLKVLADFEIVIIADDSGSMENASKPMHKRRLNERCPSRWEELQEAVDGIIDIAACFDDYGVDVHFLNREPVFGVTSSADPRLTAAFEKELDGSTPLTETLQHVAARRAVDHPMLLFVLTDGEPDGGPEPFGELLRKMVDESQEQHEKFHVQLMICTPDKSEVAWLNDMDRDLPGLDVTEDFYTEQEQVLNSEFAKQFKRGDWVMKAMLGPVSQKFDKWDEGKRTKEGADGQESCAACKGQCSVM